MKRFPSAFIFAITALLTYGCVMPALPSLPSLPSGSAGGGGSNQIVFPAGATTGVVEGIIQPAQTLDYYAWASENQPVIAVVRSKNNDATLSIVGEDKTVLLDAELQRKSWSGVLPASQNYHFQVTGGASAEDFKLLTTMMARVEFPAGQNYVKLNGQTPNGLIVSYAVFAKAGQTLEVSLEAEDAGITIWGFNDSQQFVQAESGATDYSFEVPADQDYIIDVVPVGGKVVNYKIRILAQ
ncbi:MAG: hypothetical protein PHQ36_02935 [Anaerolineales bacterium]|nr:hypothetical protein [Anaerolineales bacterium]